MHPLGIWFIKEMIQRFVERVGTASATKAQGKHKVFEEGFLAGDERRDEFVFDFDLVSPIGKNSFTDKIGPGSGEIDGPIAGKRTGDREGKLGVDAIANHLRLSADESVEVPAQMRVKVRMCEWFGSMSSSDGRSHTLGGVTQVFLARNTERGGCMRFKASLAIPNVGDRHI